MRFHHPHCFKARTTWRFRTNTIVAANKRKIGRIDGTCFYTHKDFAFLGRGLRNLAQREHFCRFANGVELYSFHAELGNSVWKEGVRTRLNTNSKRR